MTYRAHVKNGQITLDEPAQLPEGAEIRVEVVEGRTPITRPKNPRPLGKFEPISLPGGPLSEDIVRDRR